MESLYLTLSTSAGPGRESSNCPLTLLDLLVRNPPQIAHLSVFVLVSYPFVPPGSGRPPPGVESTCVEEFCELLKKGKDEARGKKCDLIGNGSYALVDVDTDTDTNSITLDTLVVSSEVSTGFGYDQSAIRHLLPIAPNSPPNSPPSGRVGGGGGGGSFCLNLVGDVEISATGEGWPTVLHSSYDRLNDEMAVMSFDLPIVGKAIVGKAPGKAPGKELGPLPPSTILPRVCGSHRPTPTSLPRPHRSNSLDTDTNIDTNTNTNTMLPSPMLATSFSYQVMFSPCHVPQISVPHSPHLPYLTNGGESLYFARLFTSGYNVYSNFPVGENVLAMRRPPGGFFKGTEEMLKGGDKPIIGTMKSEKRPMKEESDGVVEGMMRMVEEGGESGDGDGSGSGGVFHQFGFGRKRSLKELKDVWADGKCYIESKIEAEGGEGEGGKGAIFCSEVGCDPQVNNFVDSFVWRSNSGMGFGDRNIKEKTIPRHLQGGGGGGGGGG